MHLAKRDVIATGLVAAAGLFYLLWVRGSAPAGMSSTRATGIVVLALGFAASATAVVPMFDQLLHGDRLYLAVTALIGLVAVVGGVQMLLAASEAGLAVVMIAMVGLWLIATIHHSVLASTPSPTGQPTHATSTARHGPRSTGVRRERNDPRRGSAPRTVRRSQAPKRPSHR